MIRSPGKAVLMLIGAALVIAAPIVDTSLRHEREKIIRTGVSVPAVVMDTARFWGLPVRRTVLRYTLHGREETAVVTHPWVTDLKDGGQTRVHVDPGDPGRAVLAEGDSSLGGQWLPMPMAVFGGVGLLAPVIGGLSLRWRRRWDARTVDDLALRPPRIRRGRGVVRRNDFAARLYFGIFAAGAAGLLAMAAIGLQEDYWLALLFLTPFLVALFLPAFSARLKITASEFLIYEPIRVTAVPRRLVTGCGLQPDGTLALVVTGSAPVIIPVGISQLLLPSDSPTPYRRRQQLLTMARIRAIVEALPVSADERLPVEPTTRLRYVVIACLVIACLVGGWAAVTVMGAG